MTLYYVSVSPYRQNRDYGILISASSSDGATVAVNAYIENTGRVKNVRQICETPDTVFTEI